MDSVVIGCCIAALLWLFYEQRRHNRVIRTIELLRRAAREKGK